MLSVCRLCLAKEANFAIFNSQVAIRIMTCTGLEVEPNDGLPQLICYACRLRLEEFHYFRKRCHGADRRLRSAKRIENNPDCQTNCLLEGDEEDAINLQDVAQCAATACSESNAHWRQEAAKLIRTEIDAYKQKLLGLCKQQVREDIEQQVRDEVEELILQQARKECRLNVLDSLFYEIESFFVRKRNAVVCEQAFGSEGFISDSEAAELESVSTRADQQTNNCETARTMNVDLDDSELGVVELPDDEPIQQTPETNTTNVREPLAPPAPLMPVPMVEINMQNVQPSLLNEELKDANFLPKTAVTPSKLNSPKFKSKFSLVQVRIKKPKKTPSKTCRKHSLRTKQRYSYNTVSEDEDCYRCRLRNPSNLNQSAS
ncbi:uncharacterized protein LOC117793002 [Drosophila innubila]|uniref:uncharacterized protein LOC117793002 n=1 Tax=Drosophila innubila TaxID=198719 RepID=UPI00148CFAAE|nr:uncharacterized protein LOC117793002 [Drosophila innubila]